MGVMTSPLARRLASIDGRSTCQLTHHGRKSGKPYEVTIWFMVEGETVYLVSANARRQWVRNVRATPRVSIRAGDETFAGVVEPIGDRAAERHVMDLVVAKYWYLRPAIAVARLVGYDPVPDASFRVRLE